jgi:primosomal protein N' (replication factor Y)
MVKSSVFRAAEVLLNTPVDRSFTYAVPEGMEIAFGVRVKVNFAGRRIRGFVVQLHNEIPDNIELKNILEVIDKEPLFDERLIDLIRYTADSYLSSSGEALSKALPAGLSSGTRVKIGSKVEFTDRKIELTPEQEKIYNSISGSDKKAHLIFGITGSGKTEIYMKLAMDAIARGKSVIYMVPEIGLSSQIYGRLFAVFGDQLILYHSHLTANQRYKNWLSFYRGEAGIVVGTRSSVFMQCPDPGLIIVDEEQDASYKEHSSPRYNARRIAFYRAMKEDALLVMGSATPSIETLYAAEKGSIILHRLDERYGSRSLPEIEIVKSRSGGNEVSPRLKLFTNQAVQKGMQALYLLNRRGFSPVVMCEACGKVVECPHCSIGMNYHKGGMLLCHYCSYTIVKPERCGSCSSESIITLGSGTQRIEDIVQKEFPAYRLFRLDQDSARKKNTVNGLIEKMEKREIDILIGTQMISKGFDFKGVAVAGIIMADVGLNMPDFRASEKIFSLMVQLAGRSGRGDEKGKVIIQTLNENHPVFEFIIKQDYWGFYKSELKLRKMLNYPPFSRLARLVVRGSVQEKVSEVSENLSKEIDTVIDSTGVSVEKLGPAEAPLSKIGGNYRYHIILKGNTLKDITGLVKRAIQNVKTGKTYIEVDIDPVEML